MAGRAPSTPPFRAIEILFPNQSKTAPAVSRYQEPAGAAIALALRDRRLKEFAANQPSSAKHSSAEQQQGRRLRHRRDVGRSTLRGNVARIAGDASDVRGKEVPARVGYKVRNVDSSAIRHCKRQWSGIWIRSTRSATRFIRLVPA